MNQYLLFNTEEIKLERFWAYYQICQLFDSMTFCEAYKEYVTGIQEQS